MIKQLMTYELDTLSTFGLQSGAYSSVDQFRADIRQIFKNCRAVSEHAGCSLLITFDYPHDATVQYPSTFYCMRKLVGDIAEDFYDRLEYGNSNRSLHRMATLTTIDARCVVCVLPNRNLSAMALWQICESIVKKMTSLCSVKLDCGFTTLSASSHRLIVYQRVSGIAQNVRKVVRK